MGYDTRELAVKITGDSTEFKKATTDVTKQSDNAKSSLANFADGAKKAAIGFGVVGAGLTLYAKSATDYTKQQVSNAKELSRETGTTIEDASRLEYAAQRLGITAQQTSAVFGIFSKNIKSAADATDPTSTKLGELGVQVKDSEGKVRSFNDILLDTADKFKGMKDGSEKTATAMDLFGKSGKDMLPLLNKGSSGIQELEKKADELGITLTTKTVGAVAKYTQSQKDLADSTSALKIQVGTLTAPILTAFNTKINDTLQALLSGNGAVKTITTSVLAFGGPVASATSAVLGFTSNLATTIEALGGVRAALVATQAFMTGPWGIAILGTTAVVGGLTLAYMNQTSNLDRLHTAQEATKASLDTLNSTQQQNKDTALQLEGVNIAVRDAQKAYNDAVRDYGPNSDQAKDANYRLRDALNEKAKAEDNANRSLDAMRKAEAEYAKDKSFELAMATKEDAIKGVDGALNSLQKSVDSQSKSNGGKGNSLGGAGNLLQTLQQAFGHNAGGTDNWQGGLTWVGEKGPELLNLPKGSQILPNQQSQAVAAGGGGSSVNVTVNVGMYAGMAIEKRQIALSLWKELVRAARAQGQQLPNIGAISVQ